MKRATLTRLIYLGGILTLAAATGLLWYAAIRAGTAYILDNDELAHIQMAYLILDGYRPYTDFFTIYTPVFHLLPALIMRIGSVSTGIFADMRIVMAALFTIRLALIFLISRRILGLRIAALTIPLYLMDPLNTFTAIQIRPDNLMLTFFLFSIFSATFLSGSRVRTALFLHTAFLALSVFTLPKIIPGAGVLFLLVTVYLSRSRKIRLIPVYLLMLLLSSIIFFLPFIANGSIGAMIRNTVFDPPLTNRSLLYPVKLGSFYYSDTNYWMYGQGGKPATWRYIWILPLLSFFGMGGIVPGVLSGKKLTLADYLVTALAGTLIAQWVSLLFIQSVFIQYYIPVTWLFAVFASAGITNIARLSESKQPLGLLYIALTLALLSVVGYTAFRGNLNRAAITDTNLLPDINRILALIPPGEKTFTNVMFRPNSYMLPYGYFYGDIPKEITGRWRPVRDYLERDRLPYYAGGDYLLNALPPEDREYIKNNYRPDPDKAGLWVRIR